MKETQRKKNTEIGTLFSYLVRKLSFIITIYVFLINNSNILAVLSDEIS